MRQKHKDQNSKSEPSALSGTKVGRTLIGSSTSIKGDLAGEEDLKVNGQFEGTIALKKSHVTIGKSGRLEADVYGKTITIEGRVQGNLFGEEKIILRQSGRVRGNMLAPRVHVEDGAKFQGNVDMDSEDEEKQPRLREVSLAKVHNLSKKS